MCGFDTPVIFPVFKGQKLVPGLAVGNPPPEEDRTESGFIYFSLSLTQNDLIHL